MRFQHSVILMCALAVQPAMADSIDINLHDNAIRGTYEMKLKATQGLSADLGLLYLEDDNRESETMVHAGLHVSGENWSKSGTFDIALGGRLVYATPGDLDVAALALGTRVRFSPVPRLGFGGHIYYAPDITAFMDSVGYQEFGLRLDYQLLPQAFVYVGYRNVEFDLEGPGELELDDEGHAGFKVLF